MPPSKDQAMNRHLFTLTAAFLVGLPVPFTRAQTCPPAPPLNDQTKKVETEGAIGQFLKLTGLKVNFKIDAEKKAILKDYPNADQLVVILTTMNIYCTAVMSDTSLTGAQKLNLLRESYEELKIVRAAGPQAIATTAASKR